jgi:hypothetical protein
MIYTEQIIEKIVYFIIFIKIIFLISTIGEIIFNRYDKNSSRSQMLSVTFSYWKNKTEFIFVFCMSLLLIYIFNPWYKNRKYISKELELLFYLFGYILLITADWNDFFSESKIYSQLSNSLK